MKYISAKSILMIKKLNLAKLESTPISALNSLYSPD